MDTEGGCWGGISIMVLKKNGGNEKINIGGVDVELNYFWKDADGEYEAGWYGPDDLPMKDGQSAAGNADEITFARGEGINVSCDVEYIGCQLVSNGQVLQAKSSYTFTHDGQNLVVNPLCREITLSELTCSGYMDTEGGCWGGISIMMLKKNGGNEKINIGGVDVELNYFWKDADGEYEAGWYGPDDLPMKDGQSAAGNADEITFGLGEGMNISCDVEYIGCQIDFPSLGLKQ